MMVLLFNEGFPNSGKLYIFKLSSAVRLLCVSVNDYNGSKQESEQTGNINWIIFSPTVSTSFAFLYFCVQNCHPQKAGAYHYMSSG